MDFLCFNPSKSIKNKKGRIVIGTHRLKGHTMSPPKTNIILEEDPYGSLPTFGTIDNANTNSRGNLKSYEEDPYGALPPASSLAPITFATRHPAQTLPQRPPSGSSLTTSMKANGVSHRSPSTPQPNQVQPGPYANLPIPQSAPKKPPSKINHIASSEYSVLPDIPTTKINNIPSSEYSVLPDMPTIDDYDHLPIDFTQPTSDYDFLPPSSVYQSIPKPSSTIKDNTGSSSKQTQPSKSGTFSKK